jgi:hypothetical protein
MIRNFAFAVVRDFTMLIAYNNDFLVIDFLPKKPEIITSGSVPEKISHAFLDGM